MAEGSVKIEPLITHRVSLGEVEKGLRLCKERKNEVIKVVINVAG